MSAAPSPDREPLTREGVVAAARAGIAVDGLDAVSLRRLGASLGVTAPALYAYVEDKRDLLRAVAGIQLAELLERFSRVEAADPVERLRLLSRVYIDFALESPELFRTMFLFPPSVAFSEATGEELPIATNVFEYAVAAIREAIASGALRNDLDENLLAFTTWTATHGLATVLLLGFDRDPSAQAVLIDTVLDTMIAGLRPGA
jgi:AcrR family transcriptional regulator